MNKVTLEDHAKTTEEVLLVDKHLAVLEEAVAVDEVVLVGKNLVKNLTILEAVAGCQ